MTRISNFTKFKNHLISKNVELISEEDISLSVPVRKEDWMYPTEYVLFKINEFTFAMYKCTTSTLVKNTNWIYIIPVKKKENSLYINAYTESDIYSIPKLKDIQSVKNFGHFDVFGTQDLDEFLNLF
jgi:hypothetical protein